MKSAQASRTSIVALAAAVAAVLAHPAHAETKPQPVSLTQRRPAPKDVVFPGVIQLDVDARDVAHRYFQVHERIPVPRAGPMTLLYPQWIPGEPTRGPIEQLAGLVITADGQRLKWVRDTADLLSLQCSLEPSSWRDSPGSALRTGPLDHPQGDHHRDACVLSPKPAFHAGRARNSPHPARSVRRKHGASGDRIATSDQDRTRGWSICSTHRLFLRWIKWSRFILNGSRIGRSKRSSPTICPRWRIRRRASY